MSEQPPKKRSLSEISHLFLSSVRDRTNDGVQRPRRTPPSMGQPPSDHTIDLTPEEFAQVYGAAPAPAATEPHRKSIPVSAIIGSHLNGRQFERVKEYARSLAERVGRVGLIELDASEFRLMCFEPAEQTGPADPDMQPIDCQEPRQIAEALEEMNWDVQHWLLLLPNLRTPEAKAILRQVDHWILLSTCDHDGVVSSYRMLKGLVEADRPLLTLSLLDAADDAEVTRVFQKMSGVCQQFLNWTLDFEPAVTPAPGAGEHVILNYRTSRDKGQTAAASHWAILSDFVTASKVPPTAEPTLKVREHLLADVVVEETFAAATAPAVAEASVAAAPNLAPIQPAVPMQSTTDSTYEDVIDLPDNDASGQSILSAVLRRIGGELVECPLRPPMCLEARLAVGRDRSIVLLAAAKQGLAELQYIGQAYRWLKENRELIAMALPQFAIDARLAPQLRLLVDRADLAADVLQPMMQSENIRIQGYRKLRWGQRLGVFLEAA